MPRFVIDYSSLGNQIEKKIYRLTDVKHRLEKVAFDVVRFKDGDPEELWQIQSADDGEYIVSRYETDEVKEEKKASTDWDVLINKTSDNVNIFYKGRPITKIAVSRLGIGTGELETIQRFLPKRLASDKALVNALLNDLDENVKKELLVLYPELS